METLEYIHPPVGAIRLRSATGHSFPESSSQFDTIPKVTVPVPNSSPPASPSPHQPFFSSMASPTLSSIPQLLLSASLPAVLHSVPAAGSAMTSSSSSSSLATTMSGFTTYNPRGKTDQTSFLSSKDPLSLPIMTNNFKRFVTVVGPAFWLQDRIEEIVLWKRGALWTTIWMAGYTLLCFYPRLLLLLPHLVLIGAILATYPYPSNPTADPFYPPDDALNPPPTAPPVESAAPWQANIQAIQNLMGACADFHAVVEPYVHHFCLTPAHFSTTRRFPSTLSSSTSTSSASQPVIATPIYSQSPYTTHILAVLLLSFFPLLFVIHLPWFPIRSLCIMAGWIPILSTHPYTQVVLSVLRPAVLPIFVKNMMLLRDRASSLLSYLFKIRLFVCRQSCYQHPLETEPETDKGGPTLAQHKRLSVMIQRCMDNDRLTDECWNSEMRQVELWENERYNGPIVLPHSPLVADGFPSSSSSSSSLIVDAMRKGWGKQHLKSGERGPWTRSRDGSNDVSAVGAASGVDASGEVSSNLTFTLAPNWSFVETEDWRKDLQPNWSGCGCDQDGWVYTNDAWLGPRPAPYTSGGGSVSRRRRWLRRVWYQQTMAEDDP